MSCSRILSPAAVRVDERWDVSVEGEDVHLREEQPSSQTFKLGRPPTNLCTAEPCGGVAYDAVPLVVSLLEGDEGEAEVGGVNQAFYLLVLVVWGEGERVLESLLHLGEFLILYFGPIEMCILA